MYATQSAEQPSPVYGRRGTSDGERKGRQSGIGVSEGRRRDRRNMLVYCK